MCALPTVKSFLGCCDLKVACITIAGFRMVLSIIVLILLIAFDFILNEEIDESSLSERDRKTTETYKKLFKIYLVIAIPVILVNVFISYLFIKGATSNNPTKMRYYLYMQVVNLFMLGLRLMLTPRMSILFAIVFECYIYICMNSLYKQECLKLQPQAVALSTEHTVIKFDNDTSLAPPQYDSCVKDTQPQNADENMHNKAYP